MIEIKSVRDLETDHRVSVPYNEVVELLESKKKFLQFKSKLDLSGRYIENFCCFGNGGSITCEELAELLDIELPKVPYMGMEKYLAIKKELEDAKKERESETETECV